MKKKTLSAVFVTMLLGQTLLSSTLSLAQETVSEVVPIEKEEDISKELPVETPIEALVKEPEALPEEVEVLEKKERGEEVSEVPAVKEKTVETVFTSLTEKEPVKEKVETPEPKEIELLKEGRNGEVSWELDDTGEILTFTGEGDLTTRIIDMGFSSETHLKKIVFTRAVNLPEDSSAFFGQKTSGSSVVSTLEKIENFEYVDASGVTDMAYMFAFTSITEINLSKLETSEALKDMSGMFEHTRGLTSVNFGEKFNASGVTSMYGMFFETSVEEINLSKLTTSEALKDMSYMFLGAKNLTSVNFGGNFNVSGVTDMRFMFMDASVKEINLSGLTTSEALKDMSYTFYGTKNLTSVNFGDDFNASGVTSMYGMFQNSSVEEINLSGLTTSEALTKMDDMFRYTENLRSVNFGDNFNVSGVTSMLTMFLGTSVEEINLSGLTTSEALKDMRCMFLDAKNLTSVNFGDNFNTFGGTNTEGLFWGVNQLETITFGKGFKLVQNSLENPPMNDLYTGRWVSLDGSITYETSADLLKTGVDNGVVTFVWEKQEKYTVTFNLNEGEGTIDSQKIQEGGILKKPQDPTRADYQFLGWFTEKEVGTQWDFENDKMPAYDFELYAHWKVKPYKVTFNLNEGTGDFEEQEVEVGDKIIKPANDPTRAGYQFLGWFTEKEVGTQWDFENDKMPASNLEFYAHWKVKPYKVTFLDISGDKVEEPQLIPTGEYITTPPQAPDRTGYTFIGWSTTKTSGSLWNFATDKVMEDITLHARYVLDDVAIIYQNNYSDLDTSVFYTDEIRYNSVLRTPFAPTRAGYAFQGWYTARTGGKLWNFNDKVAVEGTFTLYARWAAVYTVTFKNSDGKVLKTQSVVHGNTAQAPTNPTRKDYTFTGWDKGVSNITSHLTVTAKHKAVNVNFKPSVTSKTIGKKKAHTLSVKSLNVAKNRIEYTMDKKYSKLASVNKTSGKVTTKDKTGTFKVNVKVFAQNGTTKTVSVTYKTIHHVTDVLTNKGKKLATKASVKKGKTTTIKTKAISSKKTQKATSPKTTYKTSNKKVATVNKKGKIKGVKKGTATITITTTTADGAKVVKKVKVTVK